MVVAALTACDKTPMNGALDGMWQLTSVETPEGTRTTTNDRLFVSFQLHLTQWEVPGTMRVYYAHFSHRGDSLCFFDFTTQALHDLSEGDDDHLITPAEMANGLLDAWGVHTTDARYKVLRLNHQSLILQAQDTTLTFRKF